MQAMAHAAVGVWETELAATSRRRAQTGPVPCLPPSCVSATSIVLAEEVHAAPRRPTYVFYCRHGSSCGTRPVPCRAPAGACLVKPGTAPPCADATESPRRGGGLSGGDWTVSEVRLVSIFTFTRQRPLPRSRPPTPTTHRARAVADSQCERRMGMPAAAV
jgi:hypothetical protein